MQKYNKMIVYCIEYNTYIKDKEINSVEAQLKKKFNPRDGPHFSSLSKTLDTLHVQRQAYHGGSFVGNHVNKLLKVRHLTQSLACSNHLDTTVTQH